MLVDEAPLFFTAQRWASDDTGILREGCRDGALGVSSGRSIVPHEVADCLNSDAVGGQVEKHGCFQFSPSFEDAVSVEDVGHIDRHQINYCDRGTWGQRGEECFEVGLEPLAGDHDHLQHSVIIPIRHDFVYGAVEGLASRGTRSGESVRIRARDPKMKCGGYKEVKPAREIHGHPLGDERPGTQRQVRPKVVECADGPDQPWVVVQDLTHPLSGKVMQRI